MNPGPLPDAGLPRVGITCYPTQGGSGVVASELGLHLARSGCEVHFISSSLPFRLRGYRRNIFYHKVDMPTYPVFQHSPYTLSLATVMTEVAEHWGLDILHVHYAIPHAASAYLARQMVGPDRLKVVTTLHGTDITLVGQEPGFFPLTRFLIRNSDAVTAVSRFLKEETIRVFDCGRDIQVIPNFVDSRVFRPREDPQLRARFARPDERLVIHASNFRTVKNVPLVVDVFAAAAAQVPARLLLAGEGPELPAVRRQVAALGLNGKVEFLGQVDNLAEILPVCDLLLLPSRHESFGLAGLEAMACGVVPVVTSRGGADEFIQDGGNGFLRDPEDVPGLVETVTTILRDDDRRQQMAEEGVRNAAADFGAQCVMREYLQLYDSLLDSGG